MSSVNRELSSTDGLKSGRRLFAVALLMAALISGGGWYYYQRQYTDLRDSARETLSTIADLKAESIANWLAERRGDAEVARRAATLQILLDNPSNSVVREKVAGSIKTFQDAYGYAAVILADANGRVLMKTPADSPLGDASIAKHAQLAVHSRDVVFSDLNRDAPNEPIYAWLDCPIFSPERKDHKADGAVLLVMDPSRFLYPTLDKWPTASRSAETVLVRREGNEIVFLNKLHHATNAPGTLRLPMDPKLQLPSIQVFQGGDTRTVIQGRDYRGTPIFAVTRWIPDTPWLMIAKVDAEEILAPLRQEAFEVGTITILLLVIMALLVNLLLRRRMFVHTQASEERFRALIEKAPTAVSISRNGVTTYVNQKFVEMFRCKDSSVMIGRTIWADWAPESRKIIEKRARDRAAGLPVADTFEGTAVRADGTQFPAHVSVAIIDFADGPAPVAFIADMTERERAEEFHARLASIVESSDDAIISKTLEGVIVSWNRGAYKLFGYTAQEAVGKSMLIVFPPERFAEEAEILARIRRGEVIEHFETVRCTKGGDKIDVSISISPIRDASGKIIGVSTIARNISERKRVENSLKLFRALVNNANDSIEVIDQRTGQFLDVNERALKLHGYSREEYLAMTVAGIDPKISADGEDGMKIQLDLVRQFGALVFESEHRRKDGSVFPVEVNATYVRLDRDYIVAVVRDISERKQTERQIRRLNRVYVMLSSINALIVRERNVQAVLEGACRIATEQGKFLTAWIGMAVPGQQALARVAVSGELPALVNIDLTDPVHVTGPSATAFLSGQHQVCNDLRNDPRAQALLANILEKGSRACAAFPLKVAGRTVGNLTLHATEADFFDSDEMRLLDELAEDIGFAMEVNEKEMERKRAENDLRANEERFRLLIENASDLITVVNFEGILKYASPSAKRLLGYESGDWLKRNIFELIDPRDLEKLKATLQRLMTEPDFVARVEYRVRHGDGSWRVLQSIGRSITGQAPDGFIIVNSRDVTDSHKLEEQFRQSQKMEAIGQLAGGVAHDFNNILGAMIMQAEMAARTDGVPGEVVETLQMIRSSAQRAASLTRQLLLFSRRQVMQPRDLDVNEAITNISKMLRRLIGEDIKLQLHLHAAPLVTHVDPGMLDQVIMNLVVNARDAMPSGGPLVIETFEKDVDAAFANARTDVEPGPYVCLSVNDAGTGIPPEVLPHIFEPFFTTKDAGKGTGLGLATVFGIVKQHSGFIDIQTQAGRGTSFQIFLPRKKVKTETTAVATQAKPRGGTETILLVEDDNSMRILMLATLKRAGYTVLEASHGVEAMQRWKKFNGSIPLLLTDMVMPEGMTGRQLSEELLQLNPALKVIFISGYIPESAGREMVLKPGQKFIQKPFSTQHLLETVRNCLDG